MKTKVFSNDNPSNIYIEALQEIAVNGDECSPRGKKIKELRPVIIEYTNPLNRVTFLKGRTINPFFQLAEALWIIAGRSDVKWLTDYNKSIGQFSDDGETFNAPYGERLRFWNKNDYRGFVFNPLDQLQDVYIKIAKDPDTRQAVAVIYNPLFDNASYGGKDTPCNMILTFKLRKGKLDLQVFNRSNDITWGTFGANLCQFSTILELVASWLGVEVGTYFQNTDSLHMYLEDYGFKANQDIFKAYGMDMNEINEVSHIEVAQFNFQDEPRITADFATTVNILDNYFKVLDPIVSLEDTYKSEQTVESLLNHLDTCPDDYFKMTFHSMVAYQAHKKGSVSGMLKAMSRMADSSWKVSCLRFLYPKYQDNADFKMLYDHLSDDIKEYIEKRGE